MKLTTVSAKTKIRHKTDINKTLSRMPLAARRVLFMAIAQLDDPRRLLAKGHVFRVYACEYAKIANVDVKAAYKQLKSAAETLQKQTIGIPKDQLLPLIPRAGERPWERPSGKGIRMMNITEYCDYEDGDGYIDISFSRQMEPYICMLENQYTTQVLISTTRLTDPNASSLYQIIRQKISEKKDRYFDIGVDELKDEMGLYTLEGEQKNYFYPEFKNFNKIAIKRSLETISEITELKDLKVEIIERRQRKATKLRISYRIDEQIAFEGF